MRPKRQKQKDKEGTQMSQLDPNKKIRANLDAANAALPAAPIGINLILSEELPNAPYLDTTWLTGTAYTLTIEQAREAVLELEAAISNAEKLRANAPPDEGGRP
jgi:hypothetical protein